MWVLVTGGAGHLGSTLGPLLRAHGHEVTLVDRYHCDRSFSTAVADVRDRHALAKVMENQEVVVHCAALHGVHMATASDEEFLDVNLLGTQNVLASARQAGVRRIILISSTSVHGVSRRNSYQRAVLINEDTPTNPEDINDLSKVLSENLCRYHQNHSGLQCITLRIGRFFVDDWATFNLAKLFGGIDVRDVAEAVCRAVEAPELQSGLFCVCSYTRFTADDLVGLIGHADAVIEARYPGARALFASAGLQLPQTVHRVVDVQRAREQLGFNPTHNFDQFLEEIARGRRQDVITQTRTGVAG